MPVPGNGASEIPHRRTWSILFRTLHLGAISVLVGGHVFNAPVDQLRLILFGAIGSGVGLAVVEAYPSPRSVLQGWGIVLMLKLLLLCTVPFAWNHRVPILLVVLAIASVGSHMGKSLRHSSPVFRNTCNNQVPVKHINPELSPTWRIQPDGHGCVGQTQTITLNFESEIDGEPLVLDPSAHRSRSTLP
jgi:hypothetical protein